MTLSHLVSALSIALSVSLLSGAALADVPGPREVCDPAPECGSCWESYGSDQGRDEAFNKCSDPFKAKGFVEACRHRQGAGDNVFFCPPGVEVEKTIRGGGCGACSVGAGELNTGLELSALGLLVLALRLRRHKK